MATDNRIYLENASAGSAPDIVVAGDDTNISLVIKAKGTGAVQVGQATSAGLDLTGDQPIRDSSGNEYIKFSKTASAVNEITITNAATGNNASVTATGGDNTAGISIAGKAGGAATAAGGTIVLAGGAGNTTGAGGAVSLTGGVGGNDAVGGQSSIAGGAAGGGNRAGGAIVVSGGAGSGTGAGGVVTATSGAGAAATDAATGGASGAVTIAAGTTGTAVTGTGGAGGAIAVTGAAGGATSGAAGVGGEGSSVSITAGAGGADGEGGSGTGGAGGSITLTAGAGGAGNTAGAAGSISLASTTNVTVADALKVNSVIVPQYFYVHFSTAAGATGADYDHMLAVLPEACELVSATERHGTAGSDGGAVTLMVQKVPSGTASGSGTDCLSAGINLKATADTNQAGSLHATPANYQFAAGNSVAMIDAGTLTAVDNVFVTLRFKRI